ncbi:ATP-binding protein [Parafrankia sp. BMG5.11]|uniref:AAA family ATPase n=1 Tax=Parafrankia sp. BMG5.11 TaxID=222540 RepID=UPI0014048ABC|nr:ATP-binding protein [Parafrankia sp. BMG5.11]
MTPIEAALFVSAWCDAVERMSPHQLRDRGKQMLEVFDEHIARPDHQIEDEEELERPIAARYSSLLGDLAFVYRPHRRPRAAPLDRRVEWLAQTLGLDEIERALLAILARVAVHDEWAELLTALPGTGRKPSSGRISFLTGLRASRIEERLAPGSRLSNTGLVDNDGDGEVSASDFLTRIARSPSGPARLSHQLMPAAARSSLAWEDFAHIGPQREIAEKLVGSQSGASILLYGPPGTGKTEFARLLASRANMRAVFAGLSDEAGQEPSRRGRIAHFTVLRALTRNCPTRLLVMDEADDILQLGDHDSRGRRSKLWLNRLVEEGERPTVWIINEPRLLEESIIRRMSIAIEFPRPPLPVRHRIIERHAKKTRLRLTEEDVARLASLPAAPALLASAVQGAKKIGGGGGEAWLIGEGLVTVTKGRPPAPFRLPSAYDPTLAVADTDLEALARQLSKAPERGWSLLLSGPSGTGKSAYARHLAERLGVEIIDKRGSDLLGMYVGETEANIARAFRKASQARALLLIDEADDFLTNRRDATRGWERSMVNEMLRQMEALECPFVATTNLADQLDPATQRRFTMRIEFRALDHGRASALFRNYFGTELPAGTGLHDQTPGDFSVVAKRAAILGERDPSILVRWLLLEAEARTTNRSIGF